MHIQKETRAERFVDGCARPVKRKGAREDMTEGAESSQLRSRLNQVSAQSKSFPVNVEHLIALGETVITMLDKIMSEIEDIKKSQRHG